MSKKPHPLDGEFEVEGSNYDDEFDEEVIIPDKREEQNLELVIELALKQYKINCDDMGLMDPKTRLKSQEINHGLLNTAKDAKYKLERIRIEREKLERMKGKSSGSSGANESGEGEPEEGKSLSRAQLMEQSRVIQGGRK